MKKLLVLLFSLLISFNSHGGLFDKTVCVDTETVERGGLIYLPNKTKPFSGKNLCKYANGQNKSKGKIKDGKKNDIWTEWYENGQIQNEGNYIDGKKDSQWTWWYENGLLKIESNYKNGKLSSTN